MKYDIEQNLKAMGYHARRPEIVALRGLLVRANGSMRALLLEGSPGAGKSFLAEALSRVLGGPFVFHLLHSWSDDQELFCGVDVAAAVAGDASHVRQPGVLARAAELSQQASPDAPVVVCLDEVDKVQDRTENLLLDFLQTGRVPVQPGIHLQAKLDSIIVILTSNGTRPLTPPLLRRVRRVYIGQLPADVVERVLVEKTQLPTGLVRVARKAAYKLAEEEGKTISVQELELMLLELLVAEGIEDVRLTISGWVSSQYQLPPKEWVAPVWGELQKMRRGC